MTVEATKEYTYASNHPEQKKDKFHEYQFQDPEQKKDEFHEYQSQDSEQTDTEEETDKKCPSCGGVMDFQPGTGMLACPYCGYEEKIEEDTMDFVAEELDFSLAEDDDACDWGTATRIVICKACGAETVYDFNEVASECPYCGSNQIMEQKSTRKVMAPGGVLPFQFDAKEAARRFQSWIKGKLFCPREAKEQIKPKALKGLYLPFWTFDSHTQSHYTGQYGTSHTWRDRNGKTHTHIDWHHTRGHYQEFFDDILVCGSARQDASMLNGIEPFDTTKLKEYTPEYMAGFMAERYTIKVKSAWERAKEKIENILRQRVTSKIQREHGTSYVQGVRVETNHQQVTYKYVLLPVWISSFQYRGKLYHFMINGQTGKVSGKTPISPIRVTFFILGIAAFLFLVHLALHM